jgi:hypothetical protein
MSDTEYNSGLQAGRNRMDELKVKFTPVELEEWLNLMIEHQRASQERGTDTLYDAGFVEGALQRFKEPFDPHIRREREAQDLPSEKQARSQ